MYAPEPQNFRISVPLDEFLKRPASEWLVEGFIPATGFMLLYGEPAVGKTFLSIDIACAVASGIKWRGTPTRGGSVLLIAAEDSAGTRKRLRAYCVENHIQCEDLEMRVSERGIDLMDSTFVDSVVDDIRSLENCRLVVVDTLAASAPGVDENTSRDMGKFINNCKQVSGQTGVVVLVVHHCGKDQSRGARGWSGLKAAADTVVNIQKRSNHIVAIVEKQKNWVDGCIFSFELKQVHMCPGDPMDSSCVIQHIDNVCESGGVELGEIQQKVVNALKELTDVGIQSTEDNVLNQLVSTDTTPFLSGRDRRRERYQRSIKSLLDRGVLINVDDCLRIKRVN